MIEQLAQALNARRYGAAYRSACPVCGGSDRASKFTFREDGGKLLVHCFGGCSQGDVISELRCRGLWPDVNPEQREKWHRFRDKQQAESAKTWLLLAESAVERGDLLSKREQQRLTLLRRLYGGQTNG